MQAQKCRKGERKAAVAEQIDYSVAERIGVIRINRPEKRNALTQAMYASMADALDSAEADPQVRVLVLTGTDSVFSAGNDIADFLTAFSMEAKSPVVRFLRTIDAARKPVVAAVNGPAIGIGATVLLHCDLAYAGQGARFQFPFVNLGLVPEAGSSLMLPQMMGHRRAAALLLLAEPFDAATALRSGLINAVVDDEQVLATALTAARTLAAKPPASLRQTKELMKRWPQQQLREAMDVESTLFAERLHSPEANEALQAFMQRRATDFSQFD
jgi:enoyl-CoA hydratase/carnithine racemase